MLQVVSSARTKWNKNIQIYILNKYMYDNEREGDYFATISDNYTLGSSGMCPLTSFIIYLLTPANEENMNMIIRHRYEQKD